MSAIHILRAHLDSYRERRVRWRWGDISRHYYAGNGSSGTDFHSSVEMWEEVRFLMIIGRDRLVANILSTITTLTITNWNR